jgi:2-oxoglutarate/2-oxoacid ferredoxin oxidoreductase subunit alpha
LQKNYQILNGSELISQAAADAGVNFFAGYPITPASSIYTALLNKLQDLGRIAIGASDEISALVMCIGASIRGAKSMTATSAPGLSLMVESIGYAFATETPCVIVHGQRLGPSTGAATQSAQGDISFVRNFISGGYEIPVLAINSITDSYETTYKAINLSEQLRTPVILLTEKDIIMSQTNVETTELEEIKKKQEAIQRPYFDYEAKKERYRNYEFDNLTDVPEFLAPGIGTKYRTVVTASMHDKDGNLSKNSPEAFEVLEHLRAKIEDNIDKYSFYKLDDKKAKVSIISFLASDLSAKAAIKKLQKENIVVNQLSLTTLFPILKAPIQKLAKNSETIIIPEINFGGQYTEMIRASILEANPKCKIVKINCQADLISPDLIVNEVKNHV